MVHFVCISLACTTGARGRQSQNAISNKGSYTGLQICAFASPRHKHIRVEDILPSPTLPVYSEAKHSVHNSDQFPSNLQNPRGNKHRFKKKARSRIRLELVGMCWKIPDPGYWFPENKCFVRQIKQAFRKLCFPRPDFWCAPFRNNNNNKGACAGD